MNRSFKIILLSGLLYLSFLNTAKSQCTLPGGAIQISQASFGNLASISTGQVYYVPPGAAVTVDHSGSALSVLGTILVMSNSAFLLKMGSNSITLGVSGSIKVCDESRFDVSPLLDFTLNGNNPSPTITLGFGSHLNFCSMHDAKFNTGNVYMNDYSSLDFSNYHNLGSNSNNLIVYTGSGSVGVGAGNPIFHSGGGDFVNYSNTNNFASNVTNSTHIDYVNDNLGSDRPGSANYCGPKTAGNYATCRTQWSNMQVTCYSSTFYQYYAMSLQLTDFTALRQGTATRLNWSIDNTSELDHFELERSDDNSIYYKVATILPGNDILNSNHFSFTDYHPGLTVAMYRLKVFNKEGRFIYSKTISLQTDLPKQESVICYPNPFKDHLNVNTFLKEPMLLKIECFTISGNKIAERNFTALQGNSVNSLNNFSSLQTGLYIIKIHTNNNSYYQQLFKE